MGILENLKPREVWSYFEEILTIPRPSKREEKIIKYLIDFGKKHELESKKDASGNILIKKAATPGKENLKTVILQSHVDMVCEKNANVQHDFNNDPIRAIIDNGWIRAENTTLGADNGIGIAVQLALLASDNIEHGPVECLFTVDEETGLTGAFNLEKDFFEGDILINLDSEDDGEVFMGCAGGVDTLATLRYKKKSVPSHSCAYKISVSGLKGGHSGDDIEKELGNAVKILSRTLWIAKQKFDIRIASLKGGNLRNAIPREAEAVITLNEKHAEFYIAMLSAFEQEVKSEYKKTDSAVKINFSTCNLPDFVINKKTRNILLNLLHALPHGVIHMSTEIENLVETSTNLAAISMTDSEFTITTSQRSSVDSRKDYIANTVKAAFELAGAKSRHTDGYPGWKPNTHSEILRVTEKAYETAANITPKIKAIHAGLECGLFLQKYPHLDMVSIGPTIKGAHSPDERMEIETVERFWNVLLEILRTIPVKNQ